jgi:hypothetical protein
VTRSSDSYLSDSEITNHAVKDHAALYRSCWFVEPSPAPNFFSKEKLFQTAEAGKSEQKVPINHDVRVSQKTLGSIFDYSQRCESLSKGCG